MTVLMMMYENVYVDVSTMTWLFSSEVFYDYIGRLVKGAFLGFGLPLVKRVMFGSDQMLWPETIEWAIDRIEQAPFLTDEQKRDIFYNNAKRFLRL
jgi:predicted TIM-barrel fold metal-dependent hydrolase